MMLAAVVAAIQLIVFCAGAASSVVRQIAGPGVVIHVGTVGQIRKRLAAGEHADVVIVSAPAMKKLAVRNAVALGRSPMAVGVRAGAPLPDISTVDAFRRTLLHAHTIAATDPAAGASSGIYFAHLLRRLGIADTIAPKEKLTPGGRSCELVAARKADICVQNLTEIVPVKGVVVVGRLPAAIQNYITYSAGVWRTTASREAAKSFIAELSSLGRAALWRDAGFDPP